jgi:hypothetical protein
LRLFYFKYDDDDYVSEMDEKVVMINLELTGLLYADDVTPKNVSFDFYRPNACVVEEVPGSKWKIWTECKYYLPRKICGQKT